MRAAALFLSLLIVLLVTYGCNKTSSDVRSSITAPLPPLITEESLTTGRAHSQRVPSKTDADVTSATPIDKAIKSTQRALDTLDKKDQPDER